MGFKERPKRVTRKKLHDDLLDVKKPRRGSIAWDARRLGQVFQPIMFLCDTAVAHEVTLQEILMLVKAGYQGAVKRKAVLDQCTKKGHDGKPGQRCKRCHDRIEQAVHVRRSDSDLPGLDRSALKELGLLK